MSGVKRRSTTCYRSLTENRVLDVLTACRTLFTVLTALFGFSNEANAEKNTIIVGRVGSYCGSLYYSDRGCWVTDNAIRANAIDGHETRFLFFLLQTLRLNDRRAGSGQPLLNQTILSSIPVTVPLLPEQRTIAHILGTLDDKIELNRRMNETLEAMARALFKSWFVDFDPVRAKMAGRDTGLPQDLADLFPDQLVDSELGEIPEEWEVKPKFLDRSSRIVSRFNEIPARGLRIGTCGRDAQDLADLFPDQLVDSELGEIPEEWEVKVLAECTDLTMGQSPPGSPTTDMVKACLSSRAGLTLVSDILRIEGSVLPQTELPSPGIHWSVSGHRSAISTWPGTVVALGVALLPCASNSRSTPSLPSLLRFLSGFWFRLICPQK